MEAEIGIKNIELDLGGLQSIDDIGSYKQKLLRQKVPRNYTSQVNLTLIRCFFIVFSENLGRRCQLFFDFASCMHLLAAAGLYEFHFKFKE